MTYTKTPFKERFGLVTRRTSDASDFRISDH